MLIFRGLRFKPDVEIGLFGIFEMASKISSSKNGGIVLHHNFFQ